MTAKKKGAGKANPRSARAKKPRTVTKFVIVQTTREALLDKAQAKLYQMAGGAFDSGSCSAARMTTEQRSDYFWTPEFRDWSSATKDSGVEIFWLTDLDKTMGAGDIFTMEFDWRLRNNKITPEQAKIVQACLRKHRKEIGLGRLPRAAQSPKAVLQSFVDGCDGKPGLKLFDFWTDAFWPSQFGITREERLAQLAAYAPEYAKRIYPHVTQQNQLLEAMGVNYVIVSNGQQELAMAVAPLLGIKPENVVGATLLYDEKGLSTGVKHHYDVFDKDWEQRPQPGKTVNFHYWLHKNRARFGWEFLNHKKWCIAGRDGDSASSDLGMMVLMEHALFGNYMVDTPGEPDRLKTFIRLAAKYSWTKGQFITLVRSPSELGFRP